MAIRDFGNSLLANVRQRSDENKVEARRYAEKQGDKTFLQGLAVMGVGKIAQGVGGFIKDTIGQKTVDFLADTSLQNNQIYMSKATTEIEEQTKDYTDAKEKDISLNKFYLNQNATQRLAQLKIEEPENYTLQNDKYYISALMEKQINIDKAAKQVEYNTKVRGMANDFASGKASGRTLQSLATAEKERGLTSRFFRKITGQTTSVEAFNASMNDLRQVEIAKELYAINPEVLEAANLVALKTGSPSAAAAAVGMNFTDEQREIILEKAKQGYKSTFTTETKQDVNGQLRSIVTETTTSPNGTVIGKPKVTSSQVGDATKTLTTEEMSTILSNNNKIMENVVEMVGQEGKADFIKEAIKQGIYKDPSDMTVDDYLKLQQLSFDVAKYTKITPKSPISEEVAMARAEFLKSQESNLRIMGNDALPEKEKRAAQNEIILGLTMIEEAITKSSQSAAGIKPAVAPPKKGERMPSPNGIDTLEFDGTNWVVVK
jgi:hypothetical protein